MFPYPSGQGLHVGHPEGYAATDIISRMRRMQGYNVLHPMGWDAFGLPAEQYAIKTGNHPETFTKKNIETFKKQLKMLGFSFDWDREISTCEPSYYKWTQWIFKQLYNDGLAELIEMPVNWCEGLGCVLSNDEVINGKSERGGYPVVRKNIEHSSNITSNTVFLILFFFIPKLVVVLPCGSKSTIRTFLPFSPKTAARFTTVVDFPTPPF